MSAWNIAQGPGPVRSVRLVVTSDLPEILWGLNISAECDRLANRFGSDGPTVGSAARKIPGRGFLLSSAVQLMHGRSSLHRRTGHPVRKPPLLAVLLASRYSRQSGSIHPFASELD